MELTKTKSVMNAASPPSLLCLTHCKAQDGWRKKTNRLPQLRLWREAGEVHAVLAAGKKVNAEET